MKTMLCVSAFALAAIAGQTNAAVIYDSGGFEAPNFVLGNIDTQNGWSVDPAAHTNHQVVGPTGPVNPQAGTQMVQIGQTTATRFSFPDITAGVGTRPLGEDWIVNSFDIFAPSGQTSTASFGVLAFNSAFATIAGVRIRASDRALIVTMDPDFGGGLAFGNYTVGLFAPADTWINLGVAVNVTNNQVAILSAGNVLINGWTQNATVSATLSDFDLISGSSTTTTNSMFVDNYKIESGIFAPAPGAAALLGLAGLVAGRRRR